MFCKVPTVKKRNQFLTKNTDSVLLCGVCEEKGRGGECKAGGMLSGLRNMFQYE